MTSTEPTDTVTWEEISGRTGYGVDDVHDMVAELGDRPAYVRDGQPTRAALDLLARQARDEGDVACTTRAHVLRQVATRIGDLAATYSYAPVEGGEQVVALDRLAELAAELEGEAVIAETELSGFVADFTALTAGGVGDAPDLPTLAAMMRTTLNDPGLYDHRYGLSDDPHGVYRTVEPGSVQLDPDAGTYRAVLAIHRADLNLGWTEADGLGRRTTVGPALRRFQVELTERPRGVEDDGPLPPDWPTDIPAGVGEEAEGGDLPWLEAIVDDAFGGTRLTDCVETGDGDETAAGTALDDEYDQNEAAGRFVGTLLFVVEDNTASPTAADHDEAVRPVRRFTLTLTEIPRG